MEFFGMRRYQTGHFSCNHIVQYLIERKIPDFTIKSAFWIVKFLGILGRVKCVNWPNCYATNRFLYVTLRYWLSRHLKMQLNKQTLVGFRAFIVSWQRSHTWEGHALGIWICGCSLFHKRELWASKSAGAHSTKSLKISGCKRWCPKDLRVRAPAAPVLTHSLL